MGIGPSSRELERVAAIIRANGHGNYFEAIGAWQHQFEIWHRFEPTPSVTAALACDHNWLDVQCRRCKRIAAIDLRCVRIAEDGSTTLADVGKRSICRQCDVQGRVIKLRTE